MHSVPCASGGEDCVCSALTQASKGLMEDNTNGPQAGGCDSSDCLFCQYRSISPFPPNAYARKLTSLLRKRSLNGMTLTPINSLADQSTGQGAALLSAAAAAIGSGSKRHRTISSNGITHAAVVPSGSTSGPSSGPNATAAASDTVLAPASSPHTHPLHPPDVPHDCLTMCGGRPCSDHGILRRVVSGDAVTAAPARTAEAQAAADHKPARGVDPIDVGTAPTASAAAVVSGADANVQMPSRTSLPPAEEPPNSAGPVPSSLDPLQLLNARRHQQPPYHQQRAHQCHQDHGHHREQQQQHEQHPVHSNYQRMQEGQQGLADTLLSRQQQLWEQDGPYGQQPQDQQPQGQQQPNQQQQRLVCGQMLPGGWAFRPDWHYRDDPAPAVLQELLRLPSGASSYPRHGRMRHQCYPSATDSGGRGAAGGGVTATCGGSAGIVCALEFSPDGRLLAAGGVDKQIRLYNLSGAFGDVGGEELDDDEYDDHDMGLHQLRSLNYGISSAAPEEEDPGAKGCRRGRGGGDGGGGHSVDEPDDDNNGEQYDSLLAAVQRMPSKISSMAWSPFLDGVLTVGNYDGVLMQLHVASGHQLADVEAHDGRKIWSVAHSCCTPHLAASAADDRCARLWAGLGLSHCVARVQPNPHASVCSVDFSPTCDHLLALACSDRTAYLYDMRSLDRGPMAALRHHVRPASYCRFLGGERLVTAATDASLALWDISEAVPTLSAVIPALAAVESQFEGPGSVVQHYGQPLPSLEQQPQQPSGSKAAAIGQAADLPVARAVVRSGTASKPSGCRTPGGRDCGRGGIGNGAGGGGRAEPCRLDGSATRPSRVFQGHRNDKNFVGLSVRAADGLLACGSECSRAFAYHISWSSPLATLELPSSGATAAAAATAKLMYGSPAHSAAGPCHSGCVGGGFVSAVCWQPAEAAEALGLPPLLASATSLGSVSINVLVAGR